MGESKTDKQKKEDKAEATLQRRLLFLEQRPFDLFTHL